MTLEQIKALIGTPEYDFLRTDPHLGANIMLLGLGGSHAYGLENENSDVDIRGIATNTKRNILTGNRFDQVVDRATDTTVYSLEKILQLLSQCNPNTIELLGLKPEHYLVANRFGSELIANSDMFLSKIAIHSFGGYAHSQLRRLENIAVRDVEQKRKEEHILNSISNASWHYSDRYGSECVKNVRLFIDESADPDLDTEIFMDVNLTHYPLRDYLGMWSEMKDIVRQYGSIGSRNNKAIEHAKISKHMCHLVRLYLMCFDILKDGRIVTYRESDRDFLMGIRNGKYLDDNEKPTSEFYELVQHLDDQLAYWKQHTHLPDKPDSKRIENFLIRANMEVMSTTWF